MAKMDIINKNYKEDFNLSIELVRWILKSIGAWPISQDVSIASRLLSRSIIAIGYALLLFLSVPCTVFLLFEVKDSYLRIRLTGPVSFFCMAIMKYYYLIVHENLIDWCVHQVENDWRNIKFLEDRQIMIDNAIFGRRLVRICAIFLYSSAIFFYLIVPFTSGKVPSEDGNYTYRNLPFPFAQTIIDSRKSPANEIIFTIQCASGFVLHSITFCACSLAAVFVMHACGQLEVLISFLGRLVDGTESILDTVDDRIAGIIEHHVKTLDFIAKIEELVRQISLVEIAGCTLNMCLLGYYVIMEWDGKQIVRTITYISLLFSFTFNIFIFCYIGELLTEQYDRVGNMTYMIDWYRLPGKKSLSLILIMAMSRSSTKITAGNLFDLSLTCFGDVMRTSVAYLNMLRTVTS